ncbi:TFIIH complex serine/threonine-protein kinase subunit kin28 [Nowakowskiella sp. JEL0078]|nr:TFIIH complex serine/threonine-protein kinase subunit kin28 [Nowakowskiella sp. JEL0078]
MQNKNLNLVLEFLDADLEMIIKNKSVAFSTADIKSWMMMMLEGIYHIHRSFIIHRDIKPNNCLIASDGTLKIADFGLARDFGGVGKMSPNVVTRWYRAPELFLGARHYGGGIDMSIGCIFAELMLRLPYMAGDTDIGQLDKIFQALGTPNTDELSSLKQLPLGKEEPWPSKVYPRPHLPSLFTAASNDALNLLEGLLKYDPLNRLTAIDALDHRFFRILPRPTHPSKLPKDIAPKNPPQTLKRRTEDKVFQSDAYPMFNEDSRKENNQELEYEECSDFDSFGEPEDDEDFGESMIVDKHTTPLDSATFYTPLEMLVLMNTLALDLANLLQLPLATTNVMCRSEKWDIEKTELEFTGGNHMEMLRRCGVPSGMNSLSNLVVSVRGRDWICPVCCTQEDDNQVMWLDSCGEKHGFCRYCWVAYLEGKISEANVIFRCLGFKCENGISDSVVALIVPRKIPLFENFQVVDFVKKNSRRFKPCPAVGCEITAKSKRILDMDLMKFRIPPIVNCLCGNSFCIQCSHAENHKPIFCGFLKTWLKICDAEGQNMNWLSQNTRECIKCGSAIEKNGGCARMVCLTLCMETWHGYNKSCTKFPDGQDCEAAQAAANARRNQQRFIHFYTRYMNQDEATKLTQTKIAEQSEETRSALLEETSLTFIEVEFLVEAIKSITNARRLLKYSYVSAYYMSPYVCDTSPRCNMTEMFLDNQQRLDAATEMLTEMCEQPVEKWVSNVVGLRNEVQDQTKHVKTCEDLLLKSFEQGLFDGSWEWGDPNKKGF